VTVDDSILPSTGAWFAWGTWAWIRIWALLRVQPIWSRVTGGSWWIISAGAAFALLLPLAAAGGAHVPMRWPGLDAWFAIAIGEFTFGSIWGLLVSLPTYAMAGTAAQIEREFGGESASSATSLLVLTLGMALALGLGAHRPLLLSMAETHAAFPVGAPLALAYEVDLTELCLRLGRDVLTLALALLTPLLLSLAVCDSLVFSVTRAFAPQDAPTRVVLSWLRLSVALLALGASWMTFPEAWARTLA
jgi:type III secretory pathway component EscT